MFPWFLNGEGPDRLIHTAQVHLPHISQCKPPFFQVTANGIRDIYRTGQ